MYAVFGIIEPQVEKLDTATDGKDIPEEEKLDTATYGEDTKELTRSKQAEKSVENVKIILKTNNNNKGQEARGLKIMTPNQLLTRLLILLAQKKQEIIVKN